VIWKTGLSSGPFSAEGAGCTAMDCFYLGGHGFWIMDLLCFCAAASRGISFGEVVRGLLLEAAMDHESNQVCEEHLVDALALRGDEGRGTLR
jgi:hypothetical protein